MALAAASALANTYLPVKAITEKIGVPGPAAGMALFGGLTFVFWVALAHQLTGKRYSAIATAVLVASFCLLIRPWYGVLEPAWFSLYAIAALFASGAIVELAAFRSSVTTVLGGGLGNLACLLITCLAIGLHTGSWVPAAAAPLLAVAALLSGVVGAWLARRAKPFSAG
ncbi:MAG TPA: hypothetical protein EYP63_06315 [Desulfotomaculum sp.]|nr:hypothetical protein [Desulfotomaculum sp.]